LASEGGHGGGDTSACGFYALGHGVAGAPGHADQGSWAQGVEGGEAERAVEVVSGLSHCWRDGPGLHHAVEQGQCAAEGDWGASLGVG
jgi:hypothetical protein